MTTLGETGSYGDAAASAAIDLTVGLAVKGASSRMFGAADDIAVNLTRETGKRLTAEQTRQLLSHKARATTEAAASTVISEVTKSVSGWFNDDSK